MIPQPLRVTLAGIVCLMLVGALPAHTSQTRLRVVATFSIVGDLARNVGGNLIALTTLVGPDGDTERYEPTPSDARVLGSAELILENGLGSEPWLARLYTASRSGAARVQVSEGIDLIRNDRNEPDPHFWHDVSTSMTVVRTIRDALTGIDPANAEAYAANADAYVARLAALDAWVDSQVATIPPERRKLVTSHDTFGYFARRYGFQVVGVGLQSFFTDAQPSAQQVNRLVQDIRATGTTAVFVENVTDPRLMQQVGREAGVLVAPQLYTDALGVSNSPAATYVDLVSYNVSTIRWALSR